MRKQLKTGRPKDVSSIVADRSNPDNYPTLIRYLEATGRIKHTTYATMMKARNLYLRSVNEDLIAKELKIDVNIIDRWVLCFSWAEERDRRLFEQFRKITGSDRLYGNNIGERHDRLAGSIEQVAERLLKRSANGDGELKPKDLSTLANTIKSTQEIRRTSRGENSKKSESTLKLQVSVPGNLDRLAGALIDAYDRPKLVAIESKTIAPGVEASIGRDTEFEETLNGDSDESEE